MTHSKTPADVASAGFTGELPKDQWRVDVAGGVAYISTTGRDGFRDYFAAHATVASPFWTSAGA